MSENTTKPSRNTAHTKDVTMSPNATGAEGGMTSDGEGFGVGTKFSAVLNERMNKSLNRNNGEDIVRPQANTGMIPNAGISKASRKSGRI